MGLGLGIGLKLRPNGRRWFQAASFAALCAVADFKNDVYALPALGVEQIVNGGFDNGLTGYGVAQPTSGSVSVTNGQVRIHSADGSYAAISQSKTDLVVGTTYVISFDVVTIVSGAVSVDLTPGGSAFVLVANINTTGRKNFYWTATAPVSGFVIKRAAACDVTIDNFSLKELKLDRNTYGPELLKNGDFSAAATGNPATGWALTVAGTAAATIASGTMNLTGDGTNAATGDQSFATVLGQKYSLTYVIAGAGVTLKVGPAQNDSSYASVLNTGIGVFTLSFIANSTTTWIRLQRSATGTATVDNVSLKAITAVGAYPKRAATFAEWIAFTAASIGARTYVDSTGVLRDMVFQQGAASLITSNNDFSNGLTDWVNASSGVGVTEVVNGKAQLSGGSVARLRRELTGLTIGARYTVKFEAGGDVSTARLHIGTAQGLSDILVNTASVVGVNYITFTAIASNAWLHWFNSSANTYTLDNIDARLSGENAPRFTWVNGKRQLRLENAGTNHIRRSDPQTAVVGVFGSGGLLPAEWTWAGGVGITREIVAKGVLPNGMPYIDVRWHGTNSSGGTVYPHLYFENGSTVATVPGDVWTLSVYAQIVAGTVPPAAPYISAQTFLGTSYVGGFPVIAAAGGSIAANMVFKRLVGTGTAPAGTYDNTRQMVTVTVATGETIDFTLRLALPQAEKGVSFASDPIPTYGTAVTRAIETPLLGPEPTAILQRSAGSIVVRGQISFPAIAGASASARIVGGPGAAAYMARHATLGRLRSFNGGGTNILETAVDIGAAPYGAALAFDATGRALTANGNAPVTDTAQPDARTSVWIARDSSGSYGDGYFDLIGISPERLQNNEITALAVAA